MPAGGYSGVHRRTGYKSITQHKARSPNQGSGHLFVLSHLQLAARRVCMEQGFSLCLGASDALRGAVRLIVALRLFCVEQVLDLLFDVCFRRSALFRAGICCVIFCGCCKQSLHQYPCRFHACCVHFLLDGHVLSSFLGSMCGAGFFSQISVHDGFYRVRRCVGDFCNLFP